MLLIIASIFTESFLYSRLCSRCFTGINLFHLYNNPMWSVFLTSPLHRGKTEIQREVQRELPEVTWLIYSRTGY